MRKLATLLLLALFLFNLIGYRVLFNYFQQKAEAGLVSSIDRNQYNDADLIAVKVPLSVPYQNDWNEFRRIDGEIVLNGKTFRYVKYKVENNELILMCIPDSKRMQLETEKNDFYKNTNDLTQTNNSKKQGEGKSLLKVVLSDYDKQTVTHIQTVINLPTNYFLATNDNDLITSPHISPDQPPDII